MCYLIAREPELQEQLRKDALEFQGGGINAGACGRDVTPALAGACPLAQGANAR